MIQTNLGNCLDVMAKMDSCSVDAIVTDPPYGLSFMGKKWDYDVPSVEIWMEVLRVLKPGGHLLSFAGTRTQHRMAVNIEDAGFEIRDMIAWVYGSGFPNSHNLKGNWQGWGTALKPAMEPITVARKPFKGTVADNVEKYGTGAINVDGGRVGNEIRIDTITENGYGSNYMDDNWTPSGKTYTKEVVGRWPANLIHDGSDEVIGILNDSARFFYCAKASKRDRDQGCDGMEEKELNAYGDFNGTEDHAPKSNITRRNHHPTVKPTDLMRYLCRLITPPNGIILDPFMGSGSTGKAAIMEGFSFIGIELDADYLTIANARILAAEKEADSALSF